MRLISDANTALRRLAISSRIEQKWQDPPPDYLFEITTDGLAWRSALEPLGLKSKWVSAAGVIASPVKPNIRAVEAYGQALKEIAASIVPGRNRVALAIPDYAVRVSILDFDEFPSAQEERLALIRFRLRKAVPFPIQEARISYSVQETSDGRVDVLTVVIANSILGEYEQLFESSGFSVGLVIPSSLAAICLCAAPGTLNAMVRMQGSVLSLFLIQDKRLRLARCIDLASEDEMQAQPDREAVLSALQQTVAYAEDQIGASVSRVLVSGFGSETEAVANCVTETFALPCEPLCSSLAAGLEDAIGLAGLVSSYDTKGPGALNIASRPFQGERRKKAVLWTACAALSCSLLLMTSILLHTLLQTAHLRHELGRDVSSLNQIQKEQDRYVRLVSEPQNADVLAWSVLLNELLARRGLSWAKVFEDLSTVLPPDMRLIGIRVPQVTAEDSQEVNRVQLDMVVATEHPSTLLDLLNALQTSDLFGSATVMSQTSPTQDDPSCKFRVLVRYGQKL